MRLIDMLLAAPPPAPLQVAAKTRGGNPHPDHTNANLAKQAAALARYRAVCQDEWTSTRTIENRLGFTRSTALPTLRAYEAKGLIVCRPIGGRPYNRRSGLEWRWT